MKVQLFFISLIILLFLATNTEALEPVPGWQSSCINSTDLTKHANIFFNDTLYEFNQTIRCQYGCDTQRDVCWRWPGNAIPGEYYFLFLVFALILLGIGIFRIDVETNKIRPFDLILPIIAVMLFSTLALQGNNVIDMSTGEAVQIVMVVWFCFGMAGLSIIWFIFSLFRFLHREVTET